MWLRVIEKSRLLARFTFQRFFSDQKEKTDFKNGIQAFEMIADNENIFVDKSLFIKELLEKSNSNILITRPRRWGKTTNLSMLKNFFQPDVNKQTGEILYNQKSKEHLFKGLKINDAILMEDPVTGEEKETKLISCLGSFPVINLVMNGEVQDNRPELLEYFSCMIAPAFKDHSYLLNSGNLKGEGYKVFEKCINDQILTYRELTTSMAFLIEALHNHYERQVIFLLDEYDRYLMNSIAETSPLYAKALSLTQCLLSSIENYNNMLKLVVFTGESKMILDEVFTGLNYFRHSSVMRSDFSEFFGFTLSEVDNLIEKVLQQKPELKNENIREKVIDMYNGYSIGGKMMYNPLSISNCLQAIYENEKNPFLNYWNSNGSVAFIKKALLKLGDTEKIEALLAGSEVKFNYNNSIQFEGTEIFEDDFLSFLVDAGYLTKANNGLFRIPNKEVRSYFYNDLLPAWLSKLHSSLKISDLLNLNLDDLKEYEKSFQEKVLDKIGIDLNNENTFQNIITLPFLECYSNKKKYIHEIGKKATEGTKIDILFQPIEGLSKNVFIFELKKIKNLGLEKKVINEAFLQILEKNYAKRVLELAKQEKNKHWEKIYLRAAVFSKDAENKKYILSTDEAVFDKEGFSRMLESYKSEASKITNIAEWLKTFQVSPSKID